MSTLRNLIKVSFAGVLAIGLAACGGGGTKAPEVVNTAPSLTLGGTGSINEGAIGDTGITVSATDEQGDTVTYEVSDARFDVVGGMLVVVAGTMLDYEMERSIAVDVTASDGELSETETVSVTVANVDDNAPTLNTHGTRGSIIEGETGGTGVTFTVDDNDMMLGSLMFSTDVAGFDVIDLGGGRYELEVTQALDREAADTVNVVVTATDGSGSANTPTLIIAVGGVDDTRPMLGMSGSGMVDENATGDTGVFFMPTDADGDTMFTFAVEGVNRDHFRVVPAGFQYALQVAEGLDFEADGGTVSVTVAVADSAGMIDSATFDVTVNNLNDNAPVVTTMGSAAIDEENMGSTMLKLEATDADGDSTMWSVDDARFTIDADGYLVLNQAIDYDGAMGSKSVTLNVTATDGAHDSAPTVVMVTINPVNDNDPVITVSGAQVDLDEGTFATAMSTGVMVSVMDDDGDMPAPMVDDTRFTIDANGNLVIAAGSMFDYEDMADQSIVLMITANDGVNDATARSVTVMFMDVNDNQPMLTVTDNQGGEALKVVVRDEGEVSANTPTDHKVVVSDADSHETPIPMVSDDRFFIDENEYLTIRAGESFNFEDDADKSIALQITAVDDAGNMADPYTITFNIANVDEPPMIVGERAPELVMGPYGDGHENVTTFTATDPDNPDQPFIVRWSTNLNPDQTVWTWTENSDGDEYTLGMKASTYLGKDGPAAHRAADDTATPPVTALGYTGYTADDARNLQRHLVDVDDAELDERAVVRPMQVVDQIETSTLLNMYGRYSVDPSKAHVDGATATTQPRTEMFIPIFDELTNGAAATDFVNTPASGSTPADNRLLTDAEIHTGINRGDFGGTDFSRRSTTVYAAAADITDANIGDAYNTRMVSPENPLPMEPMGLDIVTDTRAVDVTTGAIKSGQELAIRYRFAGVADIGTTTSYNDDVALIDNSKMVMEEYRNTNAYATGDAGSTATNSALTTATDSGDPLRVGATNVSAEGAITTLSYAKYGLWAYNNTRDCSTCPDAGLRGATAFGLKARPGDLDTQDHVGVWDGVTVAFWGTEAEDGSIDPTQLGTGTGTARIAVNFRNDKVQANMGGFAGHTFRFEGMLNGDNLGYTASIDTTTPSGTGEIVSPDADAGQLGTTPVTHNLAIDSDGNVHARGMLSGAFYGPQFAAGSTVGNAMASAETAGTWQITDVPHIAASPDDEVTIVIGAFGADLTENTRLSDLPSGTETGADDYKFIGE